MPLYVAEFQFRYNNRFNADIFGTAIEAKSIIGAVRQDVSHLDKQTLEE
jgi:hypothetical protein